MSPLRGRLVLVPNTLDLGAPQAPSIDTVLPAGVLQNAARLAHWVAEDAKTTRAFLKRVDAVVPLARPLQAIEVRELPRPPKGRAAGNPAEAAASPNIFEAGPADDALRRCIMAGFIDQLCLRRTQGSLECAMTEGRQGTLLRESVVQSASLFVATSVRDAAPLAKNAVCCNGS